MREVGFRSCTARFFNPQMAQQITQIFLGEGCGPATAPDARHSSGGVSLRPRARCPCHTCGIGSAARGDTRPPGFAPSRETTEQRFYSHGCEPLRGRNKEVDSRPATCPNPKSKITNLKFSLPPRAPRNTHELQVLFRRFGDEAVERMLVGQRWVRTARCG